MLIGRDKELSALTQFVEQTARGKGHVALIAGEAGIGKSRLVAETIRRAEKRGAKIFKGSCFETDRALPYAPLTDLLRDAISIRPDSDIPLELAPILPELGLQNPTPVLDPEQDKRRLFHALAEFYRVRSNPSTLIVVEDLHWCDDSTLEFLLYFARRISSQPIFLLCTFRSDETTVALEYFLAELDRARLSTELRLNRLAPPETDAMLRAIFELNRPVRSDFLSAIYPLTEGNPFFIEEVLKSLIVAGDIFYLDGTWDRKPINELQIPRTIQDAVRRRAKNLSAPAKELLALASVVGQRFDFPLVRSLLPLDEQKLLQCLKELLASQLIVEESPDQFAFRHALTRQAVYSQLLGHERIVHHHKIAESLERAGAAASELAYHFYRAGAWTKTAKYSQRAGEQAQALDSPRAAIQHFTHALESAKHLGLPPMIELLHARGRAYETLGDFENARSDLVEALERAKDKDAEWATLLELGKLWTSRNYAKSGEFYEAALERGRETGDASKIASSLNRIGNWHSNLDQPQDAIPAHQEALANFVRLEDRTGVAETTDLLAMAYWIGGDLSEATIHYTHAVKLFREIRDRQGLVSSLATLSLRSAKYKTETLASPLQKLSDANPDGEEALRIARAIESRAGEAYSLWCLGASLASQGEFGHGLELTQESLAIAEEIQHKQWQTAALCMLGGIHLDLLDFAIASNHLEHALALAKEIGSRHWIRIASAQLAMTLIAQKDLARADSVLNAAIPRDAPMDSVGKRQCWLARAELALSRREMDQALIIANELIASAVLHPNSHPFPPGSGSVIARLWKLRADALVAQDSPEAETVLREGVQVASEQGALPLLWRLLLSLGKASESEEEFEGARRVIQQIAANISDVALRANFVSNANALMPTTRALTDRQFAKKEFGGLTVREREIAAMIAQGKSNREIADTLVVSERTVETHVGNMLSKLGFRSRSQIAAWAAAKRLGN